jgi:cytochrome c oxidase assembly protein subunit 15
MLNKSNLLKLSVVLAMSVVTFGAYTRLKDAGLGCPDWPGCFGQAYVSKHVIESDKAWIEMLHRYIAGTLGLLIFYLGWYFRQAPPRQRNLTYFLCGLVIFQAMLGMWTVTKRLYPVVVMAHLLGGLSIVSLLWFLHETTKDKSQPKLKSTKPTSSYLSGFAYLVLTLLITQIVLGGWTSANYAAVACNGFPTCNNSWWPKMNWQEAFNFINSGIFDSPGQHLSNIAKVTIHMAHRLGALILSIAIFIFSGWLYLTEIKKLRQLSIFLIALLALQLIFGVSNVLAGLPISVAVLHNAMAAILLLTLISILTILHEQPSSRNY